MFSSARRDHQRIEGLERRVRHLEGVVAELARRAGMDETELRALRAGGGSSQLSARVRDLADRGEVIAAIKEHRGETGAGLKEAKDAVDAYRSRSV